MCKIFKDLFVCVCVCMRACVIWYCNLKYKACSTDQEGIKNIYVLGEIDIKTNLAIRITVTLDH